MDRDRRRLVTELRCLRARTGLSYARLGCRTGYSRSSWERFLNGKQLPPRSAVEALARLAGADPAPAVRCWELANGRIAAPAPGPAAGPRPPAAPAPPPSAPPTPPTISRGRFRLPRTAPSSWLILLAAVLLVTVTAVLYAAPGTATHRPATAGHRAPAGGLPPAECGADATVLHAAWIGHARVQVRHSPTCRTVWAHAERLLEGDVLTVFNGGHRADTTGLPTASSHDSPMLPVDPGDAVGTCLDLLHPAVADRTCTGAVRIPDRRP